MELEHTAVTYSDKAQSVLPAQMSSQVPPSSQCPTQVCMCHTLKLKQAAVQRQLPLDPGTSALQKNRLNI